MHGPTSSTGTRKATRPSARRSQPGPSPIASGLVAALCAALVGCASNPQAEAGPDTRASAQPTAAACSDDGPKGSREQFANKGNAKIDEPKSCEGATYIRVHGAGSRRFVMGEGGEPRGCTQAPLDSAPATDCPELFADAFGRDVTSRLADRGVQTTGLGLGACGEVKQGDYDAWNFSVSVADWAQADLAVTAVSEELSRWGAGGHFGVTVKGIPCATPLAEGSAY